MILGLDPAWAATVILVGASANPTVAGMAEHAGVPFRFWAYAVYAVPMTLVAVALSQAYIWLRYFWF